MPKERPHSLPLRRIAPKAIEKPYQPKDNEILLRFEDEVDVEALARLKEHSDNVEGDLLCLIDAFVNGRLIHP